MSEYQPRDGTPKRLARHCRCPLKRPCRIGPGLLFRSLSIQGFSQPGPSRPGLFRPGPSRPGPSRPGLSQQPDLIPAIPARASKDHVRGRPLFEVLTTSRNDQTGGNLGSLPKSAGSLSAIPIRQSTRGTWIEWLAAGKSGGLASPPAIRTTPVLFDTHPVAELCLPPNPPATNLWFASKTRATTARDGVPAKGAASICFGGRT